MYNDKLAVLPSDLILTSRSRGPCFTLNGPSGLLNDADQIVRWISIDLNKMISRSGSEIVRSPGVSRFRRSYCSLHQ